MPLRESRGAQRFPALPTASRDYALRRKAGQTHPSCGQSLKTGCYTRHSPFSEAFFIVLQVVNFFRRLLSEGALNSAFVPIWVKLRGGEDGVANANRFTVGALATVGTITGIIVLITAVGAPFIIAAIAPGEARLLLLLAVVITEVLVVGVTVP